MGSFSLVHWLIIIALGYLVIKLFVKPGSATGEQSAQPEGQKQKPYQDHLKEAADRLSRIITACKDAHQDAFPALAWMAASDGTVSRQELRIIIGFCKRHGAIIDASWEDALEHLNAGMKISIGGSEKEAIDHVSAITTRPINYRAAFLGAVEALAASNKTVSAAKNRMLEAARKIIEE